MKKIYKDENGITMVTLTITIIIMIILAGVTVIEIMRHGNVTQKVNIIKEESKIEQQSTTNKIDSLKREWGNVLNQSTIENEVDNR